MSKKVTKSRVFAVVLTFGAELGAYFIHKRVEVEGDETRTGLEIESHKTKWPATDRDSLIELLVTAGLTVRFFDREEAQWMDRSKAYGYVRAPGTRDGTWGPPTTVEDFEKDYLLTV